MRKSYERKLNISPLHVVGRRVVHRSEELNDGSLADELGPELTVNIGTSDELILNTDGDIKLRRKPCERVVGLSVFTMFAECRICTVFL